MEKIKETSLVASLSAPGDAGEASLDQREATICDRPEEREHCGSKCEAPRQQDKH